MMYSKGDTFKTEDGSIGLVLDSRISGLEFCLKYNGKEVPYIASIEVHMARVDKYWEQTVNSGQSHDDLAETFYYPVLVGDKKGWMELEDPITHGHEMIEVKGKG